MGGSVWMSVWTEGMCEWVERVGGVCGWSKMTDSRVKKKMAKLILTSPLTDRIWSPLLSLPSLEKQDTSSSVNH